MKQQISRATKLAHKEHRDGKRVKNSSFFHFPTIENDCCCAVVVISKKEMILNAIRNSADDFSRGFFVVKIFFFRFIFIVVNTRITLCHFVFCQLSQLEKNQRVVINLIRIATDSIRWKLCVFVIAQVENFFFFTLHDGLWREFGWIFKRNLSYF